MATSDKSFLRAFAWFQASVNQLQSDIPATGPVTLAAPLAAALRTQLGLQLDKTKDTIDPAAFAASRAEAQSLATATLVTGEVLSTLKLLGELLKDIQSGGALAVVGALPEALQQIDRILKIDPANPGKPPSAYSIAKLLLMLSGDTEQPDTDPPARLLIHRLRGLEPGAISHAQLAEPQMIIGLVIMAVGTVLDRSFSVPNTSQLKGWATLAGLPVPGAMPGNAPAPRRLPRPAAAAAPAEFTKKYTLARSDDGSKKLDLILGFQAEDPPASPARLMAQLQTTLGTKTGGSSPFQLELKATGSIGMAITLPSLIPLPASIPPPELTNDAEIGLFFGRKDSSQPLIIGNKDQTHFSIGEISAGISLKKLEPQIEFDLKDARLLLKVGNDGLLAQLLGDQVEVGLNFGLVADVKSGLRLKDGTGLKATVPIDKIPGSPVQISFICVELRTKGPAGKLLNNMELEISGSFQVDLGPFKGSIDRMGTVLKLDDMLGGGGPQNAVRRAGGGRPRPAADIGNPLASFGFKPPSGAGMVIDVGPVKGGGFLLFDPDRGEYGGVLDVKIFSIGVKAIGLLATKNPGGWSLLLIITAQLPPIQLGFGFTLTGIGGLLGVQHTVNIEALGQGLASGSLDNFLFPKDPVANAPQIINQLRTLFPFKPGGFVIGPMLELGWGTPSLVTARLGVLIEASQIVVVGQVLVQLPPAVDKPLALLVLQVDFAGGVVFDPLKVWFDGVLRDSRVLFIAITGQFAFRASFGDQPSFLLSAGGFHPDFTDLPPGLPSPFQRVGAEFSIGIIGIQYRGYFAVTSATVQAGSATRVWADIGIASFEANFEWNAIIYLKPVFRFQIDVHFDASVEVFGIDFASVDIDGKLSGPGRWHFVGRGKVHTPWPLPDFSVRIDESWGEERATPARGLALLDELKDELKQVGNWSAQPPKGRNNPISVAKLPEVDGVLLGHPQATLRFVQKRMPLAKTLDKLGSDHIEGPRSIAIASVEVGAVNSSPDKRLQDPFAAAQFIDMPEDQLLSRPSFDRFESGFELGQEVYVFGKAVADEFDYEEVNLSVHKSGASSSFELAGLLSSSHLAWSRGQGAAGRSALRLPAQLAPRVDRKLSVKPPPLAVLDVASGLMTSASLTGPAATSFWSASEVIAQGSTSLSVIEAFETDMAF